MDISIDKAVIHVLNREIDNPVLNDYELELTPDVYTFLEKHITKSLADENARKGVFNRGRNIIKEVSEKMFLESEYFIEGSKEIANQLFRAMKTNTNITSTDMIICLFQTSQEKNIAILKMDYNTTFNHDVEVVENRFKISIKRQDISLPSTNQKIQKSAFIRECKGDEEYNLIILDNQMSSKNKEESVAQFFLETFLDSELIIDDRVRTQIFKNETEKWIQKKEKEGETLGENVRNIVNTIVHEQDEIDIKAVSNELFEDRHFLKEDYIKNLEEKGLVETKFEIDKEWVEKKLARIKLKTQNDVEISMGYDVFNNIEMFEIVSNSDGSRSIVIKDVRGLVQK